MVREKVDFVNEVKAVKTAKNEFPDKKTYNKRQHEINKKCHMDEKQARTNLSRWSKKMSEFEDILRDGKGDVKTIKKETKPKQKDNNLQPDSRIEFVSN